VDDESDVVRLLTAIPVPMHRIVDTSGAGDVFHGAYVHPIWRIRTLPGTTIFALPARRLPTKSSTSETRRAYPRSPTSKHFNMNSRTFGTTTFKD
jgi:hypothetical protein